VPKSPRSVLGASARRPHPQTKVGGEVGAVRAYGQVAEALGYTHLLAYDHVVGADPTVHIGWAGGYDVSTTFHEPFVMFGDVLVHRLIGIAAGVSFDDELLYVASLAQDGGFYDADQRAGASSECFSIRGACWPADIARNAGWKQARTDRLAEAVILNLNGNVPMERGTDAHLMHGVMLDLAGLHSWRINPTNLDDVFANFPRLDQRRGLWSLFDAEADHHSKCRGYFTAHVLGFGLLMKYSSWPWGIETLNGQGDVAQLRINKAE
jgi:hypothetical protein